ncbi:dol-P-Glc:Glc(2)Man(9)GlcNAc(2)-PP-Dol alpha-1,2-glucosyltransferase-like [Ornithorhynchus anatinus]|uniref:Dol-P-Glc:Glc(2)Man(9)GlcNAc(2)-PP-Dol alpha-1,2-glucosyltransferase n=1 Tax=Ornithorhynchus anatinus TaxID=9258 RepID=A0A6I8NUG0_ORNAN|nr:dol-P-Glc:Glc(2)Man(9)GlcNAc(2)-PP-Dol alpha-1,2-glucosyltransferase-like [Ornithorhynchus anatinus]
MARRERCYLSAALSCTLLVSCLLFSAVGRALGRPYMDELFHLPQAQRYCRGRFDQWDPMITTPPGLYLVSVGVVKPAVWIFGWSEHVVCSIGMLRFVNLLFSVGNFYLLYLLLCKIQHRNKAVTGVQRILSALTLAVFPTLYFFTFLYYTETGSVFFTLFAYLMCLDGNHKTSALLGFCGIMFRQTNVVWAAFCAGSVLAQKVTEAWKTELQKKKEERLPYLKGPVSELRKSLRFLLGYVGSAKNLRTLVLLTWPYVLLVSLFAAFVVFNGGVAVGDRSSHEACLHFPQLFYFFSFTLFFSFPHLISPKKVRTFLQSAWKRRARYVALTAVSLFLVWKFTYVHKYLLADNRHYTFYVWKRVFERYSVVKYLLVPGYVFAGWSIAESLKSKSTFWNLMFAVCVAAGTVPQRLFEFRYFILPYVIYRLNIPVPSVPKLLCEFGLYVAINFVTFYLFLHKTFRWPNSEDVQRFMW